jgi:hypothetical protein
MALDGTILGRCASEQMEALDDDFGDDPDVEVGTVITIVEILKPQGEPDEDGNQTIGSTIRLRHNTPDPYRVIGLMEQAKHNLLAAE